MSGALRAWQANALQVLARHERRDFLLEATPGGGKTRLALQHAAGLLGEGSGQRLVIVCPTRQLRRQWAEAAHAVGIELDPTWANSTVGPEAPGYQGVVVTYAQVASQPLLHRALTRVPTLVICDEIHHAALERQWGEGLRMGFEDTVFPAVPVRHAVPCRRQPHPVRAL